MASPTFERLAPPRLPWRPLLLALGLLLWCALCAAAGAATPGAATPVAGTGGETARGGPDEAVLMVLNRQVMAFRAPYMGLSPGIRAARSRLAIEAALSEAGVLPVTIQGHSDGQLVMIDGKLAFFVTPGDVDPVLAQPPELLAEQAAQQLRKVIAETRESRNLDAMLRAGAISLAATVAFAVLMWLLLRLRQWATRKLLVGAERRASQIKVAGARLIDRQHLLPLLKTTMDALGWVAMFLLCYAWLSFVLTRFPYTRPWGELLHEYLIDIGRSLGSGIGSALPGLGVCLVIFFIANLFIRFLGGLFSRVSQSSAPPQWLSPETVDTTRRLVAIAIWLFAVVMAYPYLPGSKSEAFKGVSVLLGLMVSLGASSLVGQGAAGLILTYTRTLRPGDFVNIGGHEGTVIEVGFFTTRIHTGLGEELTLPNSIITGQVSKNYSRNVKGPGYIIDTTVTIGYDTPWRQVEAMLCEAARRTKGIVEAPAPRVFQTALSDFYPEYRLVAQAIPSSPRPRAEVLSQLHANIQDVFNEYGVQIMSPHYMTDPPDAKTVRPEAWYAAPARRDEA